MKLFSLLVIWIVIADCSPVKKEQLICRVRLPFDIVCSVVKCSGFSGQNSQEGRAHGHEFEILLFQVCEWHTHQSWCLSKSTPLQPKQEYLLPTLTVSLSSYFSVVKCSFFGLFRCNVDPCTESSVGQNVGIVVGILLVIKAILGCAYAEWKHKKFSKFYRFEMASYFSVVE